MTRPRIYQENNVWYCKLNEIKTQGSTYYEAYLNYLLHKILL